jgi:adenine C2-methylase RlmN of 23S rRNA A2503 and tRNA A37
LTQKTLALRNNNLTGQWRLTPLIPALRRQRLENVCVQGQPDLQREFQDSQGYTEKAYFEKPNQSYKQNNRLLVSPGVNCPLEGIFCILYTNNDIFSLLFKK